MAYKHIAQLPPSFEEEGRWSVGRFVVKIVDTLKTEKLKIYLLLHSSRSDLSVLSFSLGYPN